LSERCAGDRKLVITTERVNGACQPASGRFNLELHKEKVMIKMAGLLLVAATVGYGLHAFGQVRADVRPAMAAVGSSSSNGVSFAWFYDSTERTVVACRIGQAPGDTVDCKARTTLP
jgi:hypothetical protein